MSKAASHTLFDIAMQKLGELPGQARDSISQEVLERVEDYTSSRLTDEQRKIITERMSRPRTHATDEDVRALFCRFDPET